MELVYVNASDARGTINIEVSPVSATDRVAVVAVHGIADQPAGQTVRELARLPP